MSSVFVTADKTAMGQKAYEIILGLWYKIKLLGLATGSTPLGLYLMLVRACQRGIISFRNVHTVNLDEYVGLKMTDEMSYWLYMRNNLFRWVDIKPGHIFVPCGWPEDEAALRAECQALEKFIANHGPVNVWVAGIGVNGHIGFCEAGTPFDSRTFVVELAPSTIKANQLEGTGLTHAITAGLGTVMEAECILQMAKGSKKAWAVEKTILGPITTDMPSSLCQKHSNHIFVVDNEAASGIIRHIKEKNIPGKDGHFTVVSESGLKHKVIFEMLFNK